MTDVARPRREAVLCFIRHEDALLLIEGSDLKDWAGRLDAPGGGLEPGETVLEAASRELYEETGLRLPPSALQLKGALHSENFYGRDVLVYLVSGDAPHRDVQHSDEGALRWVQIDRLGEEQNLHQDFYRLYEAVMALAPGELVDARSVFDDDGALVAFDVDVVKP